MAIESRGFTSILYLLVALWAERESSFHWRILMHPISGRTAFPFRHLYSVRAADVHRKYAYCYR